MVVEVTPLNLGTSEPTKDFVIFGDESVTAAMAAECAGEQGDYVGGTPPAMHNWLFQNQSAWKFKPAAQEPITYDFRRCPYHGADIVGPRVVGQGWRH